MANVTFKFWKLKADNKVQFELKKIEQKYTALVTKKFQNSKHDFRCKNIKKTEVPKMTSKVVYELLLRSYEHLKFFRKFVYQIHTMLDDFLIFMYKLHENSA